MPKGIKRADGKNSQSVASYRYQTVTCDRIIFRLKKGNKDRLKDYCARHGTSVNRFVIDCINKCTELNLE